jgi:hypothetical protein
MTAQHARQRIDMSGRVVQCRTVAQRQTLKALQQIVIMFRSHDALTTVRMLFSSSGVFFKRIAVCSPGRITRRAVLPLRRPVAGPERLGGRSVGRGFSLEGMLDSFILRKNVTANLNTPRLQKPARIRTIAGEICGVWRLPPAQRAMPIRRPSANPPGWHPPRPEPRCRLRL